MLAEQLRDIAKSTNFHKRKSETQYREIKEKLLNVSCKGEFSMLWMGSLYVSVIDLLKSEGYKIKSNPNKLFGIEFEISF